MQQNAQFSSLKMTKSAEEHIEDKDGALSLPKFTNNADGSSSLSLPISALLFTFPNPHKTSTIVPAILYALLRHCSCLNNDQGGV